MSEKDCYSEYLYCNCAKKKYMWNKAANCEKKKKKLLRFMNPDRMFPVNWKEWFFNLSTTVTVSYPLTHTFLCNFGGIYQYYALTRWCQNAIFGRIYQYYAQE